MPAGHGVGSVTYDTVRAAGGRGTESARRRRRGVAEEPLDAVEQVPAREEAAEHLIVQRVHPLAAHLPRVAAADDREVVLDLRAPDQLVDVRLQEERIAEAEAGREPDAGVGLQVRLVRRARPRLARVREVKLVQLVVGERREEVRVQRR